MRPMVRGPTPINILLVEDDPSDVELTRRALQRAKLQNRVWIAGDGVEALAFLRREAPPRGGPRPDLILLDLKLPNLDGRDVLMRIREEPRWQRLPVVLLTASDAEHQQLAPPLAAAQPLGRLPDRNAVGAIGADRVALAGKEGPAVRAGVGDFEVGERDDHAAAAHHQDRFVRRDAQHGVPRAATQLAAPHVFP